MLFQLLGGSSTFAPLNGVILTVIIYCTAKASGGVVNPSVATTLLATGEMDFAKWLCYVVAQLSGACCGALIAKAADPTAVYDLWSLDGQGPGCVPLLPEPEAFVPVFIWEAVGTFVLCSTVLATAVAKPGFGDVAPLAIGLSIVVNVGTSGGITGGCYNPARFFGPALVFGCRLHLIWLYWLAQTVGALLAAVWHACVLEPPRREDATPMVEVRELSTIGASARSPSNSGGGSA